ncbi:hypothetical protein EDB85DRAFT_1980576 [Lactarius pseudohatsudake]|nr:hypothetical protein EDB85DRAFT_1980576 [Lactarius pseudohatsudake]
MSEPHKKASKRGGNTTSVCLPSVSTRHRLFLGFWSTLIWHTHHRRHRRSRQCEPRAPIAMTTTQPRRGDLPGMSRLCNQGNQAPQRRPPPQPRPPCHDRSQTGVRLPMFIQKNKTSISPSIQAYYIVLTLIIDITRPPPYMHPQSHNCHCEPPHADNKDGDTAVGVCTHASGRDDNDGDNDNRATTATQ